MKRILIIQTAFLGDVILATPVITELNRLFPDATIDFLLKKGNESLLKNNPHLNKVYSFDKQNGKWKAVRALIKQFRKEQYDLVVNLHRFGSSGLIAGRSGGKKRYGFKKNPFSFLYTKTFSHTIGDGTHEVERNLSLIKEFGAKDLVRPSLFPSEQDIQSVEGYNKENYSCMAPASVWFTKQLPMEKWVTLIDSMSDQAIYLLGGPSDKELCDKIINASTHKNCINLAGKLSLLQSAALMKNATRNYVNDSGPLHIASSMNAKTTAFFCSTVTDFGFGPLSDDAVVREVKDLDCRPCGLHGHKSCPKDHFRCGHEIKLD